MTKIGKRLSKRITTAFLAIVMLLATFPMPVEAASYSTIYYSTSSTATKNTIEVSQKTLKTAKSKAAKKTSGFTQYATISSAYGMHIYHFEAPSSGYYSFHTTGSLDTIIKVYEEQNFLWMTTQFKDKGLNDDGSMADAERRNANLVLELDAGEDYYICVRGYNQKTGSYNLRVEKNQDRMLFSQYGYSKWKSTDGLATTFNGDVYGTTSKQYLTKSEVILFYWSLDPACQELVGKDVDYVYSAYKKSVSQGISAANVVMSLIPMDYAVGVTVSVLGTILDYAYGSSEVTPYDMMIKLADQCGVKYDGKRWTSRSGFMIEEYFNTSMFPMTTYFYYANNDSVRKGVSGAKGTWSK